jgi:hypothetical protein
MGGIGMAAFLVFFMQSPSFLAHQRQFEEGHGRSNGASLTICDIGDEFWHAARVQPGAMGLVRDVGGIASSLRFSQ